MILEDFSTEIMFEIIKLLSYRERRSLKLCSKKLFTLSTEAPVDFAVVKFDESTNLLESDDLEMDVMQLHLDESEISFMGSRVQENVTLIRCCSERDFGRSEPRFITENSDSRSIEKQYLRNIVFRKNVICDRFETNYRYNDNFLEESEKINARNLYVYKPFRPENIEPSEPSKTVAMWLKHMNPRFIRSVTVYMDDKNITLAGTENELKCLDTLHVLRRSDLDDNILMNLKALDIELEPANITVNGINHIVQVTTTVNFPIQYNFRNGYLKEYQLDLDSFIMSMNLVMK
ncbi:hypothetical protein GCK72_013890 [Caenorhabditis remanei]|uniref:F-box domain-containing protein n=1 Tax=Caenorhabditis remanei TaxID=31234 RepID=A0A6A5GS04_CAERE|nr:hypothetical protein GCK72_013890 [Caenorhabditis remanei]KAF1757434.1 hypothetical protein GCK72_013890 [Caenorhabditis remanei]